MTLTCSQEVLAQAFILWLFIQSTSPHWTHTSLILCNPECSTSQLNSQKPMGWGNIMLWFIFLTWYLWALISGPFLFGRNYFKHLYKHLPFWAGLSEADMYLVNSCHEVSFFLLLWLWDQGRWVRERLFQRNEELVWPNWTPDQNKKSISSTYSHMANLNAEWASWSGSQRAHMSPHMKFTFSSIKALD